mmetsp:Transcript_31454/g.51409  ORF Transcript_31454/g.51409 Transcript_31454/m.51409 type:complete len:334 (+) Transcript_31454:77-1078(+)
MESATDSATDSRLAWPMESATATVSASAAESAAESLPVRKPRPGSAPAAYRRIAVRASCETDEDVRVEWDAHPSKTRVPQWTIPENCRNKKDPGFRNTFMDDYSRSLAHVPGPGAFRMFNEFVTPSVSNRFGAPDKGKQLRSRAMTAAEGLAAGGRRRPSSAGAFREAPTREQGDETDAKRLFLSRPVVPTIPRTKRGATCADMRQMPKRTLPSSFYTPGPGAYTQFCSFGPRPKPPKPPEAKPKRKAARAGVDATGEQPRRSSSRWSRTDVASASAADGKDSAAVARRRLSSKLLKANASSGSGNASVASDLLHRSSSKPSRASSVRGPEAA